MKYEQLVCTIITCNTFESAHFDESLVNADMPPHVRYDSMQCRILEMSNTDHMPGELEIIALSNALNRSIVILKEDFSIVNEYIIGLLQHTRQVLLIHCMLVS